MASRTSFAAFLVLILIASVRIAATYNVFSETVDEPAHIGCGMEWLDRGVYRYEPQHPPLARVMTAIGPYLAGARAMAAADPWKEGTAILWARGNYDRMLALARLGILPFFWLASLVVYLWTLRGFGEPAAFFATLCFSMLPPVLAHAGLATTDMAATGTIGAAFLAMLVWLERPSWGRSALFGIALAAAVLSKFSSIAFLPTAAAMALVSYAALERPSSWKLRILPSTAVLAIACVLIWAGYRFSFDHVPAPNLWQGIRDVMEHNRKGHPGYLLGQYGEKGWWYYYPVVLSVKTPLAMLGLLCVGVLVSWRKACVPLAFSIGILAFAASFSRINLGIRHVLPVYIGFSIVTGVGAQWLWSRGGVARWAAAGLLGWMVTSSAMSHPDYLPYFNALAGDRPEKIVVDSDLDWGQDTKRLARRLKDAGATEVAFEAFSKSYVQQLEAVHEFPRVKPLDPRGPSPGWNAGSLTALKIWRLGLNRTDPLWTESVPPTERVGKGILLWYVP